MTAKRYLVEKSKEIIASIAEKYHIFKVYLFGTFARGDYNKLSDVDLRIGKGDLKGIFAFVWIFFQNYNDK